jgi:DNA-binding NtrC family response regulator
MLGASPAFRALLSNLQLAATSVSAVCISGENGTGKTLAARHLHNMSDRAARPFLAINCATLSVQDTPETVGTLAALRNGLAGNGTVLLDNVCELSPQMQTRFLSLIQDRAANDVTDRESPRLLSATSGDLHRMVIEGRFRPDLFHILQAMPIHLPPLRDRGMDAIVIAESRLAELHRAGQKPLTGLSPEVVALFRSLPWHGNVRELLKVLTMAAGHARGPLLTIDALPPDLGSRVAYWHLRNDEPNGPELVKVWSGLTLAEIERRVIEATLRRLDGSVPQAARSLGVSPSTVYRKLESWMKSDGTASIR